MSGGVVLAVNAIATERIGATERIDASHLFLELQVFKTELFSLGLLIIKQKKKQAKKIIIFYFIMLIMTFFTSKPILQRFHHSRHIPETQSVVSN